MMLKLLITTKLQKTDMAIAIENSQQLDYSDVIDPESSMIPMPTPGQILKDEFLGPLGISQYLLAKSIGVPQSVISDIISGRQNITVELGLRLSRYFGLSEGYWLRLQMEHDIDITKRNLVDVLPVIQPFLQSHLSVSDL